MPLRASALAAEEGWTLPVFYRGLHCPICLRELGSLVGRLDAFADLGVAVVAISADDEACARATQEKAGSGALRIAHTLPLRPARDEWGLWISEPAHVVLAPGGTVWGAWVQSTPFARPPRGAYDGSLAA